MATQRTRVCVVFGGPETVGMFGLMIELLQREIDLYIVLQSNYHANHLCCLVRLAERLRLDIRAQVTLLCGRSQDGSIDYAYEVPPGITEHIPGLVLGKLGVSNRDFSESFHGRGFDTVIVIGGSVSCDMVVAALTVSSKPEVFLWASDANRKNAQRGVDVLQELGICGARRFHSFPRNEPRAFNAALVDSGILPSTN